MTRCYRCLDEGVVPTGYASEESEYCDCKFGRLLCQYFPEPHAEIDMLAVSKADMDEEAYLVSAVAALDSPDTRSP